MRFAIAATDRYLGVFEAFVRAGWKPLKLFTVPFKSELTNQQAVITYAEHLGAAIQLSRMTEGDLKALHEQGCEALIVASYDWKIGDWEPFLRYAVNFHCSPLPDGRGPYPVMRAILEQREEWAVTCHRLTPEIDTGDILGSEIFPLQADECHESLDLKIQMAAKRLAARLTESFTEHWDHALPQDRGVYWKKHSLVERIIHFEQPVDSILRHIRAFGMTESFANINNTWLVVRRAVGWVEKHNMAPGQVVHVYNRTIVVVASNGYIALLDSNLAQQPVVAEIYAQAMVAKPAAKAPQSGA